MEEAQYAWISELGPLRRGWVCNERGAAAIAGEDFFRESSSDESFYSSLPCVWGVTPPLCVVGGFCIWYTGGSNACRHCHCAPSLH